MGAKKTNPIDPHNIFEDIESSDVKSIQLRNANNRKIENYLASIPFEYIKDTTAKKYGTGHYSLVALDQKGLATGTFVFFDVSESEAAVAKADMMKNAGVKDESSFAYAHEHLEAMRRDLAGERQALQARESEFRDLEQERDQEHRALVAETEAEHRVWLSEAETHHRERTHELEEEYEEKRMSLENERSELFEQLFERQREILAEAQERADALESRAEERTDRILTEAREEAAVIIDKAQRQLKEAREEMEEVRDRERLIAQRERDLVTQTAKQQAEMEREKLEYRMKLDRENMLLEMERRIDKATKDRSPFSKSLMDEYGRAQIKRMFPEETEFEKVMRQLAPIFMGGMIPDMGETAPDMMDVSQESSSMEMPGFEPPEFPPAFQPRELPSFQEQLAKMPPIGTNPYEHETTLPKSEPIEGIPPVGVNPYDVSREPEELELPEDSEDIPPLGTNPYEHFVAGEDEEASSEVV